MVTTSANEPPEWMRPESAERGLVASVLRDPDLAIDDALAAPVAEADFYHHCHGLAFGAALALRAAGRPVAMDSVYLWLVQAGRAADLGPSPAAHLADVLDAAPTGGRARYYAGRVREASARRKLWHAARRFAAEAAEPPSGSVEDVAGRWEAEIREAADAGGAAEPLALPDLIRASLADLDERQAGGGAAGLPTGLPDLDALLGGLRPGQLVVVGARPGAGKTALTLAFLAHVSRRAGVPSYLASLEMPAGEITHRLLAMATGVNLHRITRAKLSADDAERLAGALDPAVYGRTMLYVDDAPMLTTARLHAQARRMVRRRGVGLVAADYLQLMTPADPAEGRVQQVGRMARDLKLVARDCGVPVVLLSQLNRQSESRGDGRPKLSDLRESGEIEQHADAVILLHVPANQGDDSECWQVDCIVAKNRNGPVGDVPLVYRRPVVRFESAARGFRGEAA